MNIRSRLSRYEDTLRSRSEIVIDRLQIRAKEAIGILTAQVRFYNDSCLVIYDHFKQTDEGKMVRMKYVFHYQHADGTLIFRYDNAPHYPDFPTFPAHKHTPDDVIPAPAPDLADVLREIDTILYPDRQD